MNNNEFDNIAFDLPKHKSNVIKVIGVGGGGSNAINHMYQAGINGVDFVICNTDSQALENSSVPNKIQLGVSLTEGLGAGANPEVGEQAAIESLEDIKEMMVNTTKMAFITAGMGGGTGTGAAPVIAKVARDLDILTVGIVTIPFQFEGAMRCRQAQLGIERLRANVDSLIVINNNKLREVYGNLGFKAGFSKADEVLATAARGIAEVITHHYMQNIDLRDAKTVLSNSGTAIMGSAVSSGTGRANEAISKALDSPLLNDNKITGAKNVLLLIVSGEQEITIDEIGEINDHIQIEAGHGANIIMGVGEDENLGDAIAVTVIATGFAVDQQDEIVNTETKKIIHTLEDEQKAVQHFDSESTAVRKPDVLTPNVESLIIKHTLNDKSDSPQKDAPSFIITNEYIRNINFLYDEVLPAPVNEVIAETSNDEFIIIEALDALKKTEVFDPQIVAPTKKEEDQFALSFDMPVKKEENDDYKEDMTADITKIEVVDDIEVTPDAPQDMFQVETRYNLEEYMELENHLIEASSDIEKEEPKLAEKELNFEKKIVEDQVDGTHLVESNQTANPLNSSIGDLMKARVEERKRKLKDFNYKFKHNQKSVDDIEKEPAYKRQGVNLDENSKEQKISRTSLGKDSNNELQLRSNNSFLHDNVD